MSRFLTDEEMAAHEPLTDEHIAAHEKALHEKDHQRHKMDQENEAFGTHALHGFMSDTLPNVEGAAKGAWDTATNYDPKRGVTEQLLANYAKHRDARSARLSDLEKKEPVVSTLGNLGGALVSPSPVGKTKVAKYAWNGLTGAVAGGANSGADLTKLYSGKPGEGVGELKKFGSGVGKGFATGVATTGALEALGKGAKAVGEKVALPAASHLGSVLFNQPEWGMRRFLEAKMKGRNLLDVPEEYKIIQGVQEAKEGLRQKMLAGSKAAKDSLDSQGHKVDPHRVADMYKGKHDELLKRTEGIHSDPTLSGELAELKRREKVWRSYAKGTPDRVETSAILDAQGKPIERHIPGEPAPPLRASRLMEERQMLQREAKGAYNPQPHEFPPLDKNVSKDLGAQSRGHLNEISPEYEQLMEKTAKDADLLHRTGEIAPTEGRSLNVYRRAVTDKEGAGQLPIDTLKEFDAASGHNFLDQMSDAVAARMIKNPRTNGSRAVNMFSKIFAPVIGDQAAALLGGVVDKVGTPVIVGGMTAAAKAVAVLRGQGKEAFGHKLDELFDLAAKGNKEAVITLYILHKRNPEEFTPRPSKKEVTK